MNKFIRVQVLCYDEVIQGKWR